MAKDLPYFKFHATEWLMGSITLEDYETQGVFVSICAMYWNRSGQITLTEIKRRLFNAKPTAFDSLLSNGVFSVKNDVLTIKFLDEQITELKGKSEINRKNGKLGGRPKSHEHKEEKPNGYLSETETEAKKSNIEEDKDKKEIREEKKDREQKQVLPLVQSVGYVTFMDWIEENAPNVNKLPERINENQYKKLVASYDREMIKSVLTAMHNRKDLLKKYVSAYYTALNWLKRETTNPTLKNNQNQYGNPNKFERAADVANAVIAKLS